MLDVRRQCDCVPRVGPGDVPNAASDAIQSAIDHLTRRHPSQSVDIPTGTGTAHQPTGLPDDRLLPTASVARVVATSDSREIGISDPVRTAYTKRSSCAR